MIAAIQPQVKFVRDNESLLNGTTARRDVLLLLPYRRWLDTDQCFTAKLSAELTRENIQFEVVCEDHFTIENLVTGHKEPPVLVIESPAILSPKDKATVQQFVQAGGHVVYADQTNDICETLKRLKDPAVTLVAPKTVRAVVRDQPGTTLVHLLNLNVMRKSSFEDKIQPALDIKVSCRVPFRSVKSVQILSADRGTTTGTTQFETRISADGALVELTIPRLEVAAILKVEEETGKPSR
jgi:hypothetical protein